MRLLFTIPQYWPYVRRGSERLTHDVAVEMARRGHTVTIATQSPQGPSRALDAGVRVRYHAERRRLARRLGWTTAETFVVTAALEGLRGADVATSSYHSDAYGLAGAGRLRRLPLVLSFQGTPDRAGWESTRPRLHRWFLNAARRAARVTVLSDYAAERMRDDYGIEPLVMPPGIFAADFARPRTGAQRVVVCAAAIDDPRKRVDLLVDAFAAVAVDDPDLRLLLVGPGAADDAAALVARLDPAVGRRVEHRPVRTEELPQVYAQSLVGVLTSRREAFGLVVAEYLAAGLVAVAPAEGGAAEILTPSTGTLFAGDDAAACAEALRRALAMAEQPGAAELCMARARDLDWSVRGDAFEAMYTEVAA